MKFVSGQLRPYQNPSQGNRLREESTTPLRSGEAHQAGRPGGRRHSMDSGSANLHLQQQVTELEEQVNKIRAKDDLEAAPGTFSADLHQHMLGQRRYEKAATADFLGTQTWKRMRCAQLNATPGGQVAAAQYGLGFAHDETSGKVPFGKLEIGHEMNGYYQRMAPSGKTLNLCHQLYQLRYPQAKQQQRLFINSEFMTDKIVKRFQAQHPGHGPLKQEAVAPGIIAISCDSVDDWQALDLLADKFGARPSAYQVARNAVGAQQQPFINDPRVQNHLTVAALRSPHAQGPVTQLRKIPDSLSTSVLARADADMIDELTRILSYPQLAQRHQQNPLVAQGLQGIRFIAEAMPALATDSTRFGNAHRALMEEMQVLLGAISPYKANAFKAYASQRIREALPPQQAMQLNPIEPFLLSSGMQALTEALEAALIASRSGLAPLKNGEKCTQFYYEAEEYADSFGKLADPQKQSPAFYTSFCDSFVAHNSQPEHSWSLQDMIEGIGQEMKNRKNKAEPLNVVIDTTIEKEGEMKALMGTFSEALANNELRLFLCKSHQKFGNLGATKVLGGSLTLVGAKTEGNEALQKRFRHYEASQNWFHHGEGQLLTHITHAAIRHEPKMLQQSIDNGNFIAQHCFNGENGHGRFAGHDTDKPFSMLNTYSLEPEARYPSFKLNANSGKAQRWSYSPAEVVESDLIRARGSFGFTESTISSIGNLPGYDDRMLRLSHGSETKPESIERNWMLSREMQLDRPSLTIGSALHLAKQLVNDSLTPEQRRSLHDRPFSEKLRQAGKNAAPVISNQQRNEASIAELRATAALPENFTLNKVASIVGYLNHLISSEDLTEEVAYSDDRQALDELLGGFIDSGMPGVSRTGREQAVRLRCELSLEDMWSDDPETRRRGTDHLLAASDSHISRGMGVLKEAVPDKAWQEMPQKVRDRLVSVLFDRLDVNSQLEFLHHNSQLSGRGQFTQECAMRLAGSLNASSPEATSQHWQATIMQAMLRRGIITPGNS
ncbi:hypothetical protein ACA373_14020 [Erwinia sp. STN24]|uniref:hypothetical protein n=1 Tax=Erwinia sp. STN24 TaxID=3233996 RepID=UPI003522DE5A